MMKICVDNISSGETLTYTLPILIGHVEPPMPSAFITVWNETSRENKPIRWPVTNGKYRALVEIKRGENLIKLQVRDTVQEFYLKLETINTQKFVQPVYVMCCDDDGSFQAPADENNSKEAACRRIALGVQLIQTFTAEKMHEQGLPRRTFMLKETAAGKPVCHVFKSALTLSEASQKSGGDLWSHFAKELMQSKYAQKEHCKFLAFMSFTRYKYTGPASDVPSSWNGIMKYTVGHTALGGGGLALFGTGNLHTWAESLEEVTKRFTDSRKIDRSKFLDDSAYRQFHWANYATGLGASLHELGHTFDLAHTSTGIMARGFDDINRFFTIWESPSRPPSMEKLSPVTMQPPIKRPTRGAAPLLVQVESSFRALQPLVRETMTIQNYDGSITHQTFHGSDRHESQTDASGNDEASMKTAVAAGRPETLHFNSSNNSVTPVSLTPKSPPGGTKTSVSLYRSSEGGACWARSSAVLLCYHRWFTVPKANINNERPSYISGVIKAPSGIRIIELRHNCSGDVAHHWEFLCETLPTEFVLPKPEVIKLLKPNATAMILVIEDDNGTLIRENNIPLTTLQE